jgi:hypothetical protein
MLPCLHKLATEDFLTSMENAFVYLEDAPWLIFEFLPTLPSKALQAL